MNLTSYLASLKILLIRKEIKILIVCTATGGILQVICRQYMKNQPEFSEEKNENIKEIEPETELEIKNKNPRFRNFLPRGGATLGVSISITKVIIKFLAENGLLAGLITGSGVAVSKIPTTAISTYLRDAFPQNLSECERHKFTLIDGEKIYLDQCDQNLEYLFKVLKDPVLPFEKKEELTRSILTKYLNLKTADKRISFILCMVCILYTFSIHNPSGYFIILKNLIASIKEGRISKIVGRAIVRRLKKRGLLIDPELLEVVNY